MKQTIEIEVPMARKLFWEDGKIVFEDIKPQLPKTLKEFCNQNTVKLDEYFIDYNCYLTGVNVYERNEISDRNVFPSKQAAEQHLALMQLHQLRDCYRQGWKPDYLGDKIWLIGGITKTAMKLSDKSRCEDNKEFYSRHIDNTEPEFWLPMPKCNRK